MLYLGFVPKTALTRLHVAFHMPDGLRTSIQTRNRIYRLVSYGLECVWRGWRVNAAQWAGLRMHGYIIYTATLTWSWSHCLCPFRLFFVLQ